MGTNTLRAVHELAPGTLPVIASASPLRQGVIGHDHFWQRGVTRGQALGIAGGAFATALALPKLALGGNGKITTAAPTPIPPNPDLFGFRVQFPVAGNEPASIFDFNGFCGVTELRGRGTLTGNGPPQHLWFDVDNRFMTGEYVGADGKMHHGSFGFI